MQENLKMLKSYLDFGNQLTAPQFEMVVSRNYEKSPLNEDHTFEEFLVNMLWCAICEKKGHDLNGEKIISDKKVII